MVGLNFEVLEIVRNVLWGLMTLVDIIIILL